MKTRLKSLSNCYQNWVGVVSGRLYRSSCSGKVQATEGLKMSKIKDYLAEIEQDFECLYNNSMAWNKETWAEQASQDRFIVTEDAWKFSYIYWFENYPALMAGKSILREMEQEYDVQWDLWAGEWVLLTTYQSNTWKR